MLVDGTEIDIEDLTPKGGVYVQSTKSKVVAKSSI